MDLYFKQIGSLTDPRREQMSASDGGDKNLRYHLLKPLRHPARGAGLAQT
jgi:hypothetical protein